MITKRRPPLGRITRNSLRVFSLFSEISGGCSKAEIYKIYAQPGAKIRPKNGHGSVGCLTPLPNVAPIYQPSNSQARSSACGRLNTFISNAD